VRLPAAFLQASLTRHAALTIFGRPPPANDGPFRQSQASKDLGMLNENISKYLENRKVGFILS
jgi:hypothetical protein